MRFTRRGPAAAYRRLFSGYRGPLSVIVQGMLLAFIGLFLFVFNLHDYASYQQLTGHIIKAYVETNALDGSYSSSWVQLDSSNNLFNFNKTDFQPQVTEFFKGQKLDLYYMPDAPPQVVAIQSYDQFGNQTTKFVTSVYQQNPATYSTGMGPVPGLVILLLGAAAIAFGAFRYKQARDRTREDEATSAPSAAFARSPLAKYSNQPPIYTPPSKYVSPEKSLPPQDDDGTDYSFKEYKE